MDQCSSQRSKISFLWNVVKGGPKERTDGCAVQNSMYSTAATVKPVAECGCGGKRIFSSNYTGERKDLVMHRVQGADRMEDDDDAIDDEGLGLSSLSLSLRPFKRTKAKKVCSLGLRSPPQNFYNAVLPSLLSSRSLNARACITDGRQTGAAAHALSPPMGALCPLSPGSVTRTESSDWSL